jgi:hypothetical protein
MRAYRLSLSAAINSSCRNKFRFSLTNRRVLTALWFARLCKYHQNVDKPGHCDVTAQRQRSREVLHWRSPTTAVHRAPPAVRLASSERACLAQLAPIQRPSSLSVPKTTAVASVFVSPMMNACQTYCASLCACGGEPVVSVTFESSSSRPSWRRHHHYVWQVPLK